MKRSISLFLILVGVASIVAQNAGDFCPTGPPGKYCAENGVGFYWCTENGGNFYFSCPSGTVCNCFQGPECQSVPTVGPGSPCGYASVLPYFPESYVATTSTKTTQRVPVGAIGSNSTATIYMDRANKRERIDTITYTNFYGQPTQYDHKIDYYVDNENGTYSRYSYDPDDSTCMLTLNAGDLPNSRVPSGYQFLREETIDGQATDVYYVRQGGRIPSYESGLTVLLYVTKSTPVRPVREQISNLRWRNSVVSDVTWESFSVETPTASLFSLPAACN